MIHPKSKPPARRRTSSLLRPTTRIVPTKSTPPNRQLYGIPRSTPSSLQNNDGIRRNRYGFDVAVNLGLQRLSACCRCQSAPVRSRAFYGLLSCARPPNVRNFHTNDQAARSVYIPLTCSLSPPRCAGWPCKIPRSMPVRSRSRCTVRHPRGNSQRPARPRRCSCRAPRRIHGQYSPPASTSHGRYARPCRTSRGSGCILSSLFLLNPW